MLRVSEDRMSVMLERVEPGEEVAELAARVLEEMTRLGLLQTFSREELLERLREAVKMAAEEHWPAEGILLATGRMPIPPRDARLEWAGNFFEEGFSVSEDGRVDYRQRLACDSVEAGQLLGSLITPAEGMPGIDVFGKKMEVERPVRIRLRLGPGVRMEEAEENQALYSTQAGRVRWVNGTLTVDKMLRIQGNVGLETGNIAHPGSVVVMGDVQIGSRLTASGDVEVMGTVEPSEIAVGGNLVIHGGLTGAAGKRIRVVGSLTAKFIHEAQLEVGGDVTIEAELLKVLLTAKGALRMPGGRVIGGRIAVKEGIEVRQAGSDAKATTMLCAGCDDALALAKAEKQARVGEIEKAIALGRQTIDSLIARQLRLTPEQRDRLALLLTKEHQMKAELKLRRGELDEAIAATRALELARIVVRDRLCTETTLQIFDGKLTLGENMNGPLQAVLRAGRIELRK